MTSKQPYSDDALAARMIISMPIAFTYVMLLMILSTSVSNSWVEGLRIGGYDDTLLGLWFDSGRFEIWIIRSIIAFAFFIGIAYIDLSKASRHIVYVALGVGVLIVSQLIYIALVWNEFAVQQGLLAGAYFEDSPIARQISILLATQLQPIAGTVFAALFPIFVYLQRQATK